MTTKLIASGLALALVTMAAPAMAAGPGGHGPDDGEGGFPGLPDQALFGICKAFGHADEEAHAVAKPFQWLTSGMCDGAEHPGGEQADRGGPPS